MDGKILLLDSLEKVLALSEQMGAQLDGIRAKVSKKKNEGWFEDNMRSNGSFFRDILRSHLEQEQMERWIYFGEGAIVGLIVGLVGWIIKIWPGF